MKKSEGKTGTQESLRCMMSTKSGSPSTPFSLSSSTWRLFFPAHFDQYSSYPWHMQKHNNLLLYLLFPVHWACKFASLPDTGHSYFVWKKNPQRWDTGYIYNPCYSFLFILLAIGPTVVYYWHFLSVTGYKFTVKCTISIIYYWYQENETAGNLIHSLCGTTNS